jgi:hypothetical protein
MNRAINVLVENQMETRAVRLILGVGILMFSLLISAQAQVAEAAMSGAVTDASDGAMPIAAMTATNLTILQSTDTALLAQAQAPGGENLPDAPSSNRKEPSLGDLGITPEQTQGNSQQQALLDKRTHMLKIHQRMGLITAVPILAAVISSAGVGEGGEGRGSSSNSGRNLHMVLGSTAAGLYFTTAYYAIRAPRIEGTESRGQIRLHKALAFIHGPGMILTPILGAMAYSQRSKGQDVHGIASAHGAVAAITATAYGAALLSVSVKF